MIQATINILTSYASYFRLYKMAAKTAYNDHYEERMKEQLVGMLRHLKGVHHHPVNSWYERCMHDMPYRGIPLEPGEICLFHSLPSIHIVRLQNYSLRTVAIFFYGV